MKLEDSTDKMSEQEREESDFTTSNTNKGDVSQETQNVDAPTGEKGIQEPEKSDPILQKNLPQE